MTDEAEWLSGLRPSRIRAVQGGATHWTELDLVEIESPHGAALRSVLETFGIRVNLTSVGQARHLTAALSDVTSSYVVLACHGDEGRIILPELAAEVERYQPFHDGLTPEQLRGFARFNGATVIATGCDTGDSRLAEAVLESGAAAYVAPEGAPFGYASLFAPIFLFYELTEGRELPEAVERLRRHDDELAMWRLFTPARPVPGTSPVAGSPVVQPDRTVTAEDVRSLEPDE